MQNNLIDNSGNKLEKNSKSNSFLIHNNFQDSIQDTDNNVYQDSITKLIARRKNQFISSFLLFLLTGMAVTGLQRVFRPKYESSFKLLVSDPIQDDSGRGVAGNNTATQLFGLSNTVDVATLISVLQSRSILEPIVKNFSKSLPAKSKEQKDFNLTWKDFFEGKSKKLPLEINQERGPRFQDVNVLQITYQGYDPKVSKAFLERLSQVYIKYSIEQKRLKINKGISFLNQEYPILLTKLNKIESEIEAFRKKYNLIDPLEQAKFIESHRNTTRNIIDNIHSQIISTKTLLGSISSSISIPISPTSNKLNLSDAELSNSERYQTLLDSVLDVNKKLAEAKTIYTDNNPEVIALAEKKLYFEELLNKEAQKIIGRKLDKGELESFGNRSNLNKNLFNRYLSNYSEYISLTSEEKTQRSNYQALTAQLEQLSSLIRIYTSLKREYEIADKNLVNFIDIRERLRLDLAQKISSWEIVSEPILNTEPIFPNLLFNFVVSFFGGLGFGLIFIYFYDKYDNVFHTSQEIQELFKIPILTEIPYNKHLKGIKKGKAELSLPDWSNSNHLDSGNGSNGSSNPKMEREQEFFFQNESLSTLYANFEFLNTDTKLKSICITSTIPSEGKSMISILFATKIASFGKRVLLIDADLRKPQVHSRLKLPNIRGLTNIIVSDDLSFNQVVQQISDNFYVLTSGQIPPDPTRIFSSAKMKDLMLEVRDKFDYIIYDSVPLLGMSDVYFFSENIDSFLWVVSLGKVDRKSALQTFKAMKFRDLNVDGCIVNCLNSSYTPNAFSNYYKYYYERDASPAKNKKFSLSNFVSSLWRK